MRSIHLEEQDDQETSNLFYIYLYYLLYISGPASPIKEKTCDDEKKHLHSVKYDTKILKKIIFVRRQCYNHILFNKKSKIYFVLLYEVFSKNNNILLF